MGQDKHRPTSSKPYSGKHPVPKIARIFHSVVDDDPPRRKKSEHATEKDDLGTSGDPSSLIPPEGKVVFDPVTGEETRIWHADSYYFQSPPRGQNILHIDLPRPDAINHTALMIKQTYVTITALCVVFVLSSTLLRQYASNFLVFSLGLAPACGIAFALAFRLRKLAMRDLYDREIDAERKRGLAAGADRNGDGLVDANERSGESVEWLNSLLRGVWPIINSDLFGSLVDLLEDIMQASAPSHIIQSVRISDLGQGRNPLRITAIRSLPDAPSDNGSILANTEAEGMPNVTEDHVNLEVAFAYQALPSGQSASSKSRNAHLVIDFFVGIAGVWSFKLPIWVEIRGLTGTARARLHLIPDPPFVRHTIVTLMGSPQVSISVVPIWNLPGFNVMDIPLVSTFIHNSINTALAEYIAPRSLSLDLQQLIAGDDIKKDTDAMGIIIVHVHRAKNIMKMDVGGTSDPYVTICFSRLGKSIFSTRLIKNELNPIWEETAVALLDPNSLKIREDLTLQIWDSDRFSADDLIGQIDIDIPDLIRRKNEPLRQVVALGRKTGSSKQKEFGSLEFTAAYYPKIPPNPALLKSTDDPADPQAPDDLFEDTGSKGKTPVALSKLEEAVLCTPPDPGNPSGILAVQIHEIRELGVRPNVGTYHSDTNAFEARESIDEVEAEEEEGLPSSYCSMSINDQKVYQTRIKPITGTPFFNAGTERFIRDWRTSHVTVVIHDQRMREADPIIGLVVLPLADIFVSSSQLTRSYSLQGGIGHGRIRISLLFRPVAAKLPPALLGANIGAIQIRRITIRPNPEEAKTLQDTRIRLRTSIGRHKLSYSSDNASTNDNRIEWDVLDKPLTLPLHRRYSSALILSLHQSTADGMLRPHRMLRTASRSLVTATGALWLRDLVDSVPTKVVVPLFAGERLERIHQNYRPADEIRKEVDYEDDPWSKTLYSEVHQGDEEREEFLHEGRTRKVGTVELAVTFLPGLSRAHEGVLDRSGDADKESMWKEFEMMEANGLRKDVEANYPVKEALRRNLEQLVQDQNVVASSGDVLETSIDMEGDNNSNDDLPSSWSTDSEDGNSPPSHRKETQSSPKVQKSGLRSRYREWRADEHAMHREHRGTFQLKAVRTGAWIRDGVRSAAHKAKGSFKLDTREPGIETEA